MPVTSLSVSSQVALTPHIANDGRHYWGCNLSMRQKSAQRLTPTYRSPQHEEREFSLVVYKHQTANGRLIQAFRDEPPWLRRFGTGPPLWGPAKHQNYGTAALTSSAATVEVNAGISERRRPRAECIPQRVSRCLCRPL